MESINNENSQLHKIVHNASYLEKVTMEKNEVFDCIVVKSGSISQLVWSDPAYTKKLVQLDLFESVTVNQDNFFEILATKLNINKYHDVVNISIKNEIIGEEPYYLYELLYVDLEKETKYHTNENLNELASLINTNGDKIYSNAILFRNHLPSLSDSMTLTTVTKSDLERVLYERVHTKVVLWDDNFREDNVIGDLNEYAKVFFDGEHFEKLEIPFLMHNINIWYQIDSTGGLLGKPVCGDIIKKPVEKCIWFTMKSDDYRGNLTIDEVNKIIFLSKILTNYQTPYEYTEEKNDYLGRKIVYNKYKVLDHMYNKFTN
jgi:hypothetical protein